MTDELVAPFPYFGGKSRITSMVWSRLGDVRNYIEPFAGSLAMLLGRPRPFDGSEIVNDFDGMISNFWRSLQADPDAVAEYADWPINENDLTARHVWLVNRKDSLQARLEGDPDYFDAKVAGWWVWGISCWIGRGWCSKSGPWSVVMTDDGISELVNLSDSTNQGQGVKRKRVHLTNQGQGVNRQCVHIADRGRGVNRKRVHIGDRGHGVNRQRIHLSSQGQDQGQCQNSSDGILIYMRRLADRLRRVRVCCGDWTRVCGGKSGDALAPLFSAGDSCGIFLDPPYADTAQRTSNIYNKDDLYVAHRVKEWAVAHGDDPRFRIALCGYEGEHDMPASWDCIPWKARGGFSHLGNGKAKVNGVRERVWFSPYCLKLNRITQNCFDF